MKQLLITIAAVVLVGCGESQQLPPAPESKPVEPVAEVPAQPPPPIDAKTDEPVAEASQPEPPTAKASDISIHQAAIKGDIEAIKQHLAAGTDVDAKSQRGGTPLHRAAANGHKEIVELLIAKGADVNAKEEDGCTPLFFSATKEITELLVANGADVNAKVLGNTPLYDAAYYGEKEITELLIANGADVNTKGADGATPLDVSIEDAKSKIAELLRKHGGKTSEELNAKLGLNQQSSEKEKIQNFGINATPLHIAVFFEDVKRIEILIAKGANINAKDNRGWTPLDRAEGNDKLIDLLRKHGGKTGEELKAAGN